jgi:hypothetical protein
LIPCLHILFCSPELNSVVTLDNIKFGLILRGQRQNLDDLTALALEPIPVPGIAGKSDGISSFKAVMTLS